ncbi:MAG: hypothetical protein IJ682_04890 [Lachnospiraceae bacterium]|nr:hypothetical protein [Lachnospiraceae bacterium]
MLSERRVIQMTRMEMRRQRDMAEIAPFVDMDKKDYVSLHNWLGFIVGSVFYWIIVGAALLGVVSVLADDLNRELLMSLALVSVIGYIVFIFFYRSWYFRYSMRRFREAKRKINLMKKDWDILAEIYEDERQATKPTVDLDLLFPEGSLGENE